MTAVPLVAAPVLQAAVEYGMGTSAAADRVQNLARRLGDRAGDAWSTVTADPILLIGLLVVGVLVALVLRSPAR